MREALAELVPAAPGNSTAPLEQPAVENPAGPLAARTEPAANTYLLQIGRRAMATSFQVYLNAGQHPRGAEAALHALDVVEQLEAQLSIYRPDSELSRLNRTAAEQAFVASPALFELLQLCRRLHAETGGAFDVTSTPLSRLWGFHDRCGRFPSSEQIQEVLALVDSRQMHLDPDCHSVRFARPGMEVNLGGIGKGFALDQCGEVLVAEGVASFLIHGGKSSLLASGSRAGRDGGWWVSLQHPFRDSQTLGQLRLTDQALGTSGSGSQFFHHQGRRYGHILDPRTGYPAECMLATSVVAPTAALADALATALHVMDRQTATAFLNARPELGAILVCPGERAGAIETLVLGIAEDQWRSAA